MSEILSYFFSPEESMNKLLLECDRDKWKQGLMNWGLVIVLLGFLTMAAYRVSGIDISAVLGINLETSLNGILGSQTSEGLIWLIAAFISMIESFIVIAVKFLIWSCALYIVNLLLKDGLDLYQIILLAIFGMLVWLTAQVFAVIAVMIASICSIGIINEMVSGISMILEYWYLILLAIGYSVGTRCTFFKGGAVILLIQAIFWGISGAVPALQSVLG